MTATRRTIGEHDVVRLVEPIGRWPAGIEGTVVFIHNSDVVMVEMPGEAESCLDLLVDVPVELLEVTWIQGIRAVA